MWVQASEVEAYLVNNLEQLETPLTAAESAAIAEATDQAGDMIVQILAGRGFGGADLARWTRGRSYQMRLAVYFALVALLEEDGVDAALVDRYDVRDEVRRIFVLTDAAGGRIDPTLAGSGPGLALIDLET